MVFNLRPGRGDGEWFRCGVDLGCENGGFVVGLWRWLIWDLSG